MKPVGQASVPVLWFESKEVSRHATMEPPPSFHGSVNGDNRVGGGGSSVTGGLVSDDGIADRAPTRLMNMARACVG